MSGACSRAGSRGGGAWPHVAVVCVITFDIRSTLSMAHTTELMHAILEHPDLIASARLQSAHHTKLARHVFILSFWHPPPHAYSLLLVHVIALLLHSCGMRQVHFWSPPALSDMHLLGFGSGVLGSLRPYDS